MIPRRLLEPPKAGFIEAVRKLHVREHLPRPALLAEPCAHFPSTLRRPPPKIPSLTRVDADGWYQLRVAERGRKAARRSRPNSGKWLTPPHEHAEVLPQKLCARRSHGWRDKITDTIPTHVGTRRRGHLMTTAPTAVLSSRRGPRSGVPVPTSAPDKATTGTSSARRLPPRPRRSPPAQRPQRRETGRPSLPWTGGGQAGRD